MERLNIGKSEMSSNTPVRLQRAERLTTFVLEVVKCLRIDNATGGLIEAQAPLRVMQTPLVDMVIDGRLRETAP